MKIISEELQTHLNGDVLTLCRCWIVETVRGNRLGFTDHDENITIDGVLCQKDAGVESGGIEERIGLNVNSSDIAGAIQSDHITDTDIDAGKYDNARVTTYLVNWSTPTQFALDRVSLVGEITRRDGYYTMELRGLASQLDQTKGNHFVNRCQADLGDERCKVNLNTSTNRGSGIVLDIPSQLVLSVSGISTFSNGWFRGGRLTWTSGKNSGTGIEIVDHSKSGSNAVLHIWKATPEPVELGDEFTVTAGCDKDFGTCKSKFSNRLNFRGFPHIPGNDEMLQYAPNAGRFDGGPIVP